MCDADLMANTPDPQPLDLDYIRDALVNAPDYLGWEHIVALVAEVDRLNAEVGSPSFDCADGSHCYCWHDRGRYACCECEEDAPSGYGERPDEPDEPLDMDEISKRWSEAARDGGTLRWNPIVADLIIEVERLRTENADLRDDLRLSVSEVRHP